MGQVYFSRIGESALLLWTGLKLKKMPIPLKPHITSLILHSHSPTLFVTPDFAYLEPGIGRICQYHVLEKRGLNGFGKKLIILKN